MCQRLGKLREAMGHYASRFDADLLSGSDAARAVEEASAIEKMAATVKALAAARVARTDLWRRGGDRSAAHERPEGLVPAWGRQPRRLRRESA